MDKRDSNSRRSGDHPPSEKEEEFNTVMDSDGIEEEIETYPLADQCSEEVKHALLAVTEEELNIVMVSDSIKEEGGSYPIDDQCTENRKNIFCPAEEELNIVMVSDSIEEENGAYPTTDQCSEEDKNAFCPADNPRSSLATSTTPWSLRYCNSEHQEDHHHRRRRRRERIYRQRITLIDLRPEEVIAHYRLKRASILRLLTQIAPKLQTTSQRSTNIPPQTKLLAVLHMLASGTFQPNTARVAGVSQASFSRFLNTVLDAIISLTPQYLHFPNTAQEQLTKKEGFYAIAGFPHVLGAMDCIHVQLVPPAETAHMYRNRKNTYSMNVQAIVDHLGVFLNVVAKYPGSVHDSFIFGQSVINQRFQNGTYGNGLLVADQGYALLPWVMTPIKVPHTQAQRDYNVALGRTRAIVERTFGVLKSRFRCLDLSGGRLLYSPTLVCKIIIVCCILHNICVRTNTPLPEDQEELENPDDGQEEEVDPSQPSADATLRRDAIINNFFT